MQALSGFVIHLETMHFSSNCQIAGDRGIEYVWEPAGDGIAGVLTLLYQILVLFLARLF